MEKEKFSLLLYTIFLTYQEKMKGVKWWRFRKRIKINAWLDEQIREVQNNLNNENKNIEKRINELELKHPYNIEEFRPYFVKCLDRYKTTEEALEKCKNILETAFRLRISLEESYKLQVEIDSSLSSK
ncbi:hypothetical protein [Xanthovirga aplysinae]|uniref:hypothetical protein n=1 Tax=Xanthovirga aplysinae TaxID=2529853 RepID=UPI0012BCC6F2|nr:hypothetical protein [Xanthovirga aplysinae]MTI32634.1 hypothetical protein [Xanthovirga aplysinae]